MQDEKQPSESTPEPVVQPREGKKLLVFAAGMSDEDVASTLNALRDAD